MSYWHGGRQIVGDLVLPPVASGVAPRGEDTSGEHVYVSSDRHLALMYACTAERGWLYEVEPVGDLEQDPTSILEPGKALRCRQARIVRRFKPSRAQVAEARTIINLLDDLMVARSEEAS